MSEIAAIRERHHPERKSWLDECGFCGQEWPCDTAQVLAALEGLRADMAAIYGRLRHTHSDDVSCAEAGPRSHPPHFRAALADGGSAGDE